MRSLVQTARKLRKDMTEAERQVWYLLQSKNLGGFKFRRQEPLGKYVVDFVCYEIKLVIEIDGGQHAEGKVLDTKRDEWLRNQGFTVLRFWNNEVIENREAVVDIIQQYCKR